MTRGPNWLLFAGAVCASGVAGCASPSAGVRQAFVKSVGCPRDRVMLTPQHGRPYAPQPPTDEIAGDPGRLALWKKAVAKNAAIMADRTYYVVRGCNHEVLYYCIYHYPESETDPDGTKDCYDERDPGSPDPDMDPLPGEQWGG